MARSIWVLETVHRAAPVNVLWEGASSVVSSQALNDSTGSVALADNLLSLPRHRTRRLRIHHGPRALQLAATPVSGRREMNETLEVLMQWSESTR